MIKKRIKTLILITTVLVVVSTVTIPVAAAPASTTTATDPVSISGPETVEPGTTATVSFSVTNTGTSASGHILNISVPDGWEIVDRADGSGTWKASEEKWLWQTIGAGNSKTASVTMTVPDGASQSGTVEATLRDNSGITGSATQTIALADEPLTASGPETAVPGTTTTVSFSVTNTAETAGARILDLSLPESWTVTSHTDDGGSWKASERKWLWQTVGAGNSKTASVTVTVPDDASRFGTVEATVRDDSGVTGSANHTINVSDPEVVINAQKEAASGQTATVSFFVTNTAETAGARILDLSLPEGWTVASHADDGGSWKASEQKWLWQTVDAGESREPSVTVTIPDGSSGSETVTATVKDDNGIVGSATQRIDIADSQIASSGPETVEPGADATVSFSMVNTESSAGGRIVDVSVPNGWMVASHADDRGLWKPSARKWLWQTVGAGESREPSITVTAPSGASGTETVEATLKDDEGVVGTTTHEIEVVANGRNNGSDRSNRGDSGSGGSTSDTTEPQTGSDKPVVSEVTQAEDGTTTATVASVQANQTIVVNVPSNNGTNQAGAEIEQLNITTTEAAAFVSISVTTAEQPTDEAPSNGRDKQTFSYLNVATENVANPDSSPGSFRFTVSDQQLAAQNAEPSDVLMYRYHNNTWQPVETQYLGGNKYRAETPGFSWFSISTAEAAFGLTDPSLQSTTVDPGESAAVSVTVENTGDIAGDITLDLTANDDRLTSRKVSVAADSSTTETFTVSLAEAGDYTIAVNGQRAGTLTVAQNAGVATSSARDATPEPAATTTGGSGPGFTALVALLAVVGAVLLAARRQQAH